MKKKQREKYERMYAHGEEIPVRIKSVQGRRDEDGAEIKGLQASLKIL